MCCSMRLAEQLTDASLVPAGDALSDDANDTGCQVWWSGVARSCRPKYWLPTLQLSASGWEATDQSGKLYSAGPPGWSVRVLSKVALMCLSTAHSGHLATLQRTFRACCCLVENSACERPCASSLSVAQQPWLLLHCAQLQSCLL